MSKCKHFKFIHKKIESGGYNIPDGCVTEFDVYCANCGVYLAHWAYGSYIDFSKEGEKAFKIPFFRKILYKIEFIIQKFKFRGKDELPF